MFKLASLLAVTAACLSLPASAAADKSAVTPYQTPAARIIDAVRADNGAWTKLAQLCDEVGHRLSGSIGMERAVDWAVATLKADGHENVRAEPVQVPRWVRGHEYAQLLEPTPQNLVMLGLGGSVGTPPDGITAEVVVAKDEDELAALGDRVRGKILLFDNAMPAWTAEDGSGYGNTVRFRIKGPRLGAERGALAVLVRSVTATSLRSPHTGTTSYSDAPHKIPAAALAVEDAQLIRRLLDGGKKVVVRLKMDARDEGLVPSANVVAELRGREKPNEVVVIGGHLDSWDVGQGAHDDGGGCVIAMEALTALRKLGLRPRRTIRVVLYTNEENGLAGGKQYVKTHAAELKDHVAAIESDSGTFRPVGYGVETADPARTEKARVQLDALGPLFETIEPQQPAKVGWSGADIRPLRDTGTTLLGFRVHNQLYFDYHHSHADTLDKVDPKDLTDSVASMAIMAYVLAEMPGRLGD